MYTVGSIFQTTYTTSKTMFPGNTLGQQQLQSGSGKRKKELREQMRLLNGCRNQFLTGIGLFSTGVGVFLTGVGVFLTGADVMWLFNCMSAV